jgi:hypothetical protein
VKSASAGDAAPDVENNATSCVDAAAVGATVTEVTWIQVDPSVE